MELEFIHFNLPKDRTADIEIIGDPIYDVYIKGCFKQISKKRYKLETEKEAKVIQGGARNVYNNLFSIFARKDRAVFFHYDELDNGPLDDYLTLTRLETPNKDIYEYWNTSHPESYYKHMPIYLYKTYYEIKTLVLSDYNKGTCQSQPNINVHPKLMVVDSKYRSIHEDYFKLDCIKIWHATGSEYDYEWAKNFDYIFWTNGPNQVKIGSPKIDGKREDWIFLPVPQDTNVVDTTGAGDTFTAAISAYLTKHMIESEIDMAALKAAGEFAIKCCQEVIQKEHCAVTTYKI